MPTATTTPTATTRPQLTLDQRLERSERNFANFLKAAKSLAKKDPELAAKLAGYEDDVAKAKKLSNRYDRLHLIQETLNEMYEQTQIVALKVYEGLKAEALKFKFYSYLPEDATANIEIAFDKQAELHKRAWSTVKLTKVLKQAQWFSRQAYWLRKMTRDLNPRINSEIISFLSKLETAEALANDGKLEKAASLVPSLQSELTILQEKSRKAPATAARQKTPKRKISKRAMVEPVKAKKSKSRQATHA